MQNTYAVKTIFTAVDRITGPMRAAQSSVGRFSRSAQTASRSIGRMSDGYLRGVRNVAVAGAAAAYATKKTMDTVTNAGADFQHQITLAATRFGPGITKGTESFKALENAAKKAGAETEYTASQAAQVLDFYARAGWKPEAAIASLRPVLAFATATGTELARAADIATDVLGSMGLQTGDPAKDAESLARVMDVITKATNSANINVLQMFESLKKAGPVATAAGADFEEVAAMLALMSNSGVKSEIAGTAVANGFLNLSAPAKRAMSLLRSLGIEVLDSNKELKDMHLIISQLEKATAKMSAPKKTAIFEEIFQREGLAGLLSLVEGGPEKLEAMVKQLKEAKGETEGIAKVIRDTTKIDQMILSSAIEAMKLEIFDEIEKPYRSMLQDITTMVRGVTRPLADKIGPATQWIYDNFSGIKDVLTPIITGLVVLTGAAVLGKLVSMAGAIAFSFGGIPAVLAGTTAAVVALNNAYNTAGKDSFLGKLRDGVTDLGYKMAGWKEKWVEALSKRQGIRVGDRLSATVYGKGKDPNPWGEDSPYGPRDSYGPNGTRLSPLGNTMGPPKPTEVKVIFKPSASLDIESVTSDNPNVTIEMEASGGVQ